MTIKVLRSSLSKGDEKNEKLDTRVIEITESVDFRGMKPDVYLGIYKTAGKRQKQVIVEDFHLPTNLAIKIGKALIQQALDIEKDKGTVICLRYSSPAEKKEFENSPFYKSFIKKSPKKEVIKSNPVKCIIGEKSSVKCKMVAKKAIKKSK